MSAAAKLLPPVVAQAAARAVYLISLQPAVSPTSRFGVFHLMPSSVARRSIQAWKVHSRRQSIRDLRAEGRILQMLRVCVCKTPVHACFCFGYRGPLFGLAATDNSVGIHARAGVRRWVILHSAVSLCMCPHIMALYIGPWAHRRPKPQS